MRMERIRKKKKKATITYSVGLRDGDCERFGSYSYSNGEVGLLVATVVGKRVGFLDGD